MAQEGQQPPRLKPGASGTRKASGETVEQLDLGYEVRRLLSVYVEQEGVSMSSAIRSLATELVHLCDEHDLDPDERFDAAIEVAIKYGDRSKGIGD